MSVDQTTTLTSRVQELLVEALHVPIDQVTADLAFGDLLQWDSMGHMEVMMLLVERFGIEINTDTIASLTSVPAICSFLEEQGYV